MSSYAGRAAGSYGALGGVISFEWVPDPGVIAAEILKLAGYLGNFMPPLEASKSVAIADMQMHFDTESAPDGSPWAELSKEYADVRGAHPILQLTGELHDAAVSDAAYLIDGHDLFFDGSGLPPYATFHETGTSKMPARPFVGISEAAQLTIIEVFDAWFAGGVAGFYTRPGGIVQGRLPGGRFGARIG